MAETYQFKFIVNRRNKRTIRISKKKESGWSKLEDVKETVAPETDEELRIRADAALAAHIALEASLVPFLAQTPVTFDENGDEII